MIRYNIEYISCNTIAGWVFDSDISNYVKVLAYDINNNIVSTAFADIYRDDLKVHNIGDGKHGFMLNIDNISAIHYIEFIISDRKEKVMINNFEPININFDSFRLAQYLDVIENSISGISDSELPKLLEQIPLDIFGLLLLNWPQKYPNSKKYFPSMPVDFIQNAMTGGYGSSLLIQSVAFIRSVLYHYISLRNRSIYNCKILDYACGWGRMSRLLLKYTPRYNLYAADAWSRSVDLFSESNIHNNVVVCPEFPKNMLFDVKFDIIFAFSLFTHTSDICNKYILNFFHSQIKKDGLLFITIRPKEYWDMRAKTDLDKKLVNKLKCDYDNCGFSFFPHNIQPQIIDGISNIPYGDTAMSIDYVEKYSNFKVVATDFNLADALQTILVLSPR